MTKNDKIVALKEEFPTLKVGSDETGYTEMDADEYEATIAQWADVELAKDAKAEAEKAQIAAKIAATAKLAALGLTTDDLKALGLGTN
jgi:hypothetical protein